MNTWNIGMIKEVFKFYFQRDLKIAKIDIVENNNLRYETQIWGYETIVQSNQIMTTCMSTVVSYLKYECIPREIPLILHY